MIDLTFTNGQTIKTRCTKTASAISKALEVSPVKGSIAGTKLSINGVLYGIIDDNCGWMVTTDDTWN